MAKKTAVDVFAKWKAAMTNPATIKRMTDGVNAVTSSPMAAATSATKAKQWQDSMQSQETFQKWKDNTSGVSLDSWKTATAKADAAKVSTAAAAAQTKFEDSFTNLLAFEYALSAYLDQAMPSTTLQDRAFKAVAMMFGLTAFRKNGKATIADAVATINANSGGLISLQP